MKILPEKKIFIIAYFVAAVVNIGSMAKIGSLADLLLWLLVENSITAILVIILLRVAIWIGEKAGLTKRKK